MILNSRAIYRLSNICKREMSWLPQQSQKEVPWEGCSYPTGAQDKVGEEDY